jgi:CTP synthase
VIPHITDEIKAAIRSLDAEDVDIAITEIGGTAGDIESLPFLEAIRQFRHEIGRQNGLFIHLTLVPYIKAAGELKTKPSQQSVGILRTIGIIPDILICRCEHSMSDEHKAKLAMFCDVDLNKVIEEKDVEHSIYEVPIDLARQDVDVYILELLGMHVNRLNLDDWREMVAKLIEPANGTLEIAVVGKYISLKDAYKSIYESLAHGGIASNVKVEVRMVESEDIEDSGAEALLKGVAGILVPGGFGDRGIEGKIKAIEYARTQNIPFFGICLGMQCATIEYARNVCGLKNANSTEFNPDTPHPVIDMMVEQKKVTDKGGTMRLGAYPCRIKEGTKARQAYGQADIMERHRHRYEFNNKYIDQMAKQGFIISGMCPGRDLVEIIELKSHPWFMACQFHPEFQSTPTKPHPLFRDFVAAALTLRGKLESRKSKKV